MRNVHHYEFAGYVPSDTELQEFVDNFDSALKTRLQSRIKSNASVDAYDVRRVDVGDLPTVEFIPTAGAWNGTDTGNLLPSQCAALITFKALTPFPRSTRTYVWGLTANALAAGGLVGSGTVTDLTNFGNDILEISVTGQLNPDKVAVAYSGDPRAVTSWNEVTNVTVTDVWATQRRRRRGVGA